jgi:hypothetical protein
LVVTVVVGEGRLGMEGMESEGRWWLKGGGRRIEKGRGTTTWVRRETLWSEKFC